MAKKLTYEEVKYFIEVESDSRCKLLSETYKNNATKLSIICKCGNVFSVSFGNFKNNQRQCSKCGKLAYSIEFIKQYIEIESNSGCKLLSEKYLGTCEKMTVMCLCGDIFYPTWFAFYRGNKRECNNCSYERRAKNNRHSYLSVKEFIEVESDSGCKLISSDYKNNKSKLILLCPCGQTFTTSFNHFKSSNNRRCNDCGTNIRSKKKTLTDKEFQEQVYDLVQDEYSVIGTYINSSTNIKMKHNLCGHEYYVRPNSFTGQGSRCPMCNESKAERLIRDYLLKENIYFQREYSFNNLVGVNGGELRFDFAIINKNGTIQLLIEYDGEFHFKKIYEEQDFEKQQIHDKRKNQYCKDNNIPLLRIPYWDFENIEKILIKNIPIAI